MITRAAHIEHAILAALARHENALNAAVGVSCLHIDLKFDRSTGLATKAILRLEMENFLAVREKSFTIGPNGAIVEQSTV
jgi:hypothetical protein